MSRGVNSWTITGNLTRDPELHDASGSTVCRMGVAVNGFKDGDVVFVDVSVWGKSAQACADHLGKGSAVATTGRASLRTWDKQDGTQGAAIRLDANDVVFLGSKREATEEIPY
jgi:single-strand DNA-binding protein